MGCSLPGSSVHDFFFQAKNTRVGCYFLLQGSSWPSSQTHVPCISGIGRQILYHWATWEVWLEYTEYKFVNVWNKVLCINLGKYSTQHLWVPERFSPQCRSAGYFRAKKESVGWNYTVDIQKFSGCLVDNAFSWSTHTVGSPVDIHTYKDMWESIPDILALEFCTSLKIRLEKLLNLYKELGYMS